MVEASWDDYIEDDDAGWGNSGQRQINNDVKVLNASQIRPALEEKIQMFSNDLSLGIDDAVLVAKYLNWSEDRIIQWIDNQD